MCTAVVYVIALCVIIVIVIIVVYVIVYVIMLLDFFASARLHRVRKKVFTEERSTLFVPPKIK